MKSALTATDGAGLARHAHALKSASFNVGAKSVGELCKRLERKGKAGDIGDADELVAAIESTLERVQHALRMEMRQPA
jgi:HPt (histidine-containing phosphotransfer) domain-containing protein